MSHSIDFTVVSQFGEPVEGAKISSQGFVIDQVGNLTQSGFDSEITDGMGSATVYIPENTGYSEISIIADGFNPHYERIETPYSGEMKRIDGANRVAFLKRTLEASSDGSAGTSAGESAGDAARGAMPEHGDLKKPNGLVWIAAGALGLWWWFKGKN
jgi:hypothetical protein